MPRVLWLQQRPVRAADCCKFAPVAAVFNRSFACQQAVQCDHVDVMASASDQPAPFRRAARAEKPLPNRKLPFPVTGSFIVNIG